MKLTRGVLTATLVVMSWATTARADDSAHDKAVAAFQEGRKHIDQNNCDAAITKLRESLSFEPSVGARLSLAECYEKSDPLAAWRMLKDAANLAYINHDERLTLAQGKAAALEKRLPTIRVIIPPQVQEQAGFELRVDGELIDRFYYQGGIIATKPGKHLIEANAPLRHWSEHVVTENGGTVQVQVHLERESCAGGGNANVAAASAAPAVVAPVEAPGSTRRILGLTIAGVGIVGLASGVVFGILTLDKKSKIEELCGGTPGNCNAPNGSVDPERQSASTTATISTASFIVGGVALVGGGLLYFTAPSASSPPLQNRGQNSPQNNPKVRFAPRAGINGGTMGLEGTW
jgi:hypothetical protein